MEEKQKQRIADNCILIGEKPFGVYTKSVNTLFRGKGLREIEIRARGKNIKKAVDIAESSVKKFCHDLNLKIDKIETDTETFMAKEDNREISVSTIAIFIKKV